MPQVTQPGQTRSTGPVQLEISTSRQLTDWLAEQQLSLAFTTYQAGKIFFVGSKPNGEPSVFERTLERCMGMWSDSQRLYVSTLYQLWCFENTLPPGGQHDGYDRLYVPQLSYVTGDLDIHDLVETSSGQLVFVNTLFSCLATVSRTHSFIPLWKPSFISRLAAEDRCHLNGMALRDGRPGWVTAVSTSDVADGWRDQRRDGGVVIDVETNEVVASGLSMPHSPRFYRDKLWLHESGTGQFGYVDLARGRFEPVAFLPGYLRGLAFHGDFAIAGLSRQRENRTLSGLALDDALAARQAEARCGVQIIDLRNGDVVHWLRIQGDIAELYDVAALPGARRPAAIGFQTDEIRRVLRIGDAPPAATSVSAP